MNKIKKILFEQLQRHSTHYIESSERGIVCDDLDVDGFIEETSNLLQANEADTGTDKSHIQSVGVSLHRCKECGKSTVEKEGMVCNKCEAYREQ